jgi:hypothetical protein
LNEILGGDFASNVNYATKLPKGTLHFFIKIHHNALGYKGIWFMQSIQPFESIS